MLLTQTGSKSRISQAVTIMAIAILLLMFFFLSIYSGMSVASSSQHNNTSVSVSPGKINTAAQQDLLFRQTDEANRTPAKMTFFNVGHGDCSLIEYCGKTILVDTGKQEDHIAQRLLRKDVNRIDYLIITHPHPDHVGGLDEIQDELEIGEIIADRSYSGDFFKVIEPLREYEIENDRSSVVVFFLNGKTVVITGDNEFESQKELCAKFKLNKTPIYLLKYPHHGVDDFPLFAKIKAEIVVISAGTDGCKYHIPEYAMEEQQRNGSKIYWTARDGDVEINLP